MNYIPIPTGQFMSYILLTHSSQLQELFPRPCMCNLCFYMLSPSSSHLHSGYYSVICGVGWRVLMRFGSLLSCVRAFIMWCWACTLISVKFNCLIYKINKLKKITLKSLACAQIPSFQAVLASRKPAYSILLSVLFYCSYCV